MELEPWNTGTGTDCQSFEVPELWRGAVPLDGRSFGGETVELMSRGAVCWLHSVSLCVPEGAVEQEQGTVHCRSSKDGAVAGNWGQDW